MILSVCCVTFFKTCSNDNTVTSLSHLCVEEKVPLEEHGDFAFADHLNAQRQNSLQERENPNTQNWAMFEERQLDSGQVIHFY